MLLFHYTSIATSENREFTIEWRDYKTLYRGQFFVVNNPIPFNTKLPSVHSNAAPFFCTVRTLAPSRNLLNTFFILPSLSLYHLPDSMPMHSKIWREKDKLFWFQAKIHFNGKYLIQFVYNLLGQSNTFGARSGTSWRHVKAISFL